MTVVNASSSYCYSILLTVLRCHSFLPAHPLSQPHPTPLIHSLTRENKNITHKNFIFRVGIHCPRGVVMALDSQLTGGLPSLSRKQQNKQ